MPMAAARRATARWYARSSAAVFARQPAGAPGGGGPPVCRATTRAFIWAQFSISQPGHWVQWLSRRRCWRISAARSGTGGTGRRPAWRPGEEEDEENEEEEESREEEEPLDRLSTGGSGGAEASCVVESERTIT